MSSRHRRPQTDRTRIVDSMGLPPREPVREPYSPTYSSFSRLRGDRSNGGARSSERSFDARRAAAAAATTGVRSNAYDDDNDEPRSKRSSRQYSSDPRQDARRSIDARRSRHDSLPAARSRTMSSRKPIPAFDDDRDRRDLDDLDEEQDDDLEDDRRSDRRRSLSRRSDRGGAAPVNGRKRQDSDPHRQPEPWEDFSNAAYDSRPSTRPTPRARPDAEDDDRRRPTNGRSQRPRSYSTRSARDDDYDLEPPSRAGSRRSAPRPVPELEPSSARGGGGGGLLTRVLSKASGGASSSEKGRPPAARMERSSSRLNRYSAREPPGGRRNIDERELARIEEDEMLQAMQRRRSAADRAARGIDEADSRRNRDGSESRKHGSQLSRASSGAAGPQRQDRERQRTLNTLERRDQDLPMMSRTDAVARSRSQANTQSRSQPRPRSRSRDGDRSRPTVSHTKSTREAALAAVTGISTGAVAVSAIDKKRRNGKKAEDYAENQLSDASSDDDGSLEDAPEAPDVHDDDAIPIIVTGNAKAVRNGKQVPVPAPSAKKALKATSDDDEDDSEEEEDSDEESTEETSEGLETAAKPAPALRQAALASNGAASASRSNSKLVATSANGGAAPKGYMNFTRKSLAAAAVPRAAAGKGRPEPDSEPSELSESELSEDETSEEEEVAAAPPRRSQETPAAAFAASAGGAAVVGAGALAAQRSSQAEKDRRRAAKMQAKQEQKAAEANARAEKAGRAAEKRRAKEEASAAAAAAALAAKEAKRNEKIKLKEAKQAELERKREEESQARDRAIREKEQAEEQRLIAARELEREREEKAEARRASRRRPHGAAGPKMRGAGVRPLTPQQRHYLLKALVMLQMQSEWEELEKLGALTEYGYPFSSQRSKLTRVKTFERGEDAGSYAGAARDPYANDDVMRETEDLQEPLLLRHLFHVHLHTFPGLDQAPEKYWQKRIQPFFDEMAARNFSTSVERGEISKRRLYTLAMTRYLGSFVARGFGVRGEGETRGPGIGDPGTEKWGVGKNWGKGTVKRGLDRPERIDPDLMNEIDELFEGQAGDLWRAAGKEWSKVRRDWCAFKESIIESETGLEEVISYLDIANVKNLPPQYRNSVEFARVHAAYIFHALFVTAPNADDLFKMVKGIHALAPYWGAKQLLKYANAETMISGILSLLLARPGGAKSLIQRVFSYVIGKEAAYIQKEFVVPLRKEIDDPELTKKVEDYVRRGDRVESRRIQREAKKRGEDVLTTILISADGKLGKDAENHVLELQRCFALSPYRGNLNYAYPETTPAGADRPPMPTWNAKGSESTRARKFALLKLLLRECLKRRDREQAVEIASGSLIPAIIKDSLETVFYPAIRSIASAANLSERLGDLQKFIDDMIEVKKSGDNSIEGWIALAARHEQSLYALFHECAPISKRLWDWCQLGLDYMALSTTDPEHPADRRAPNLEVNLEELLQDARLSDTDVKKIIAEADKLARYAKWTKVRYELDARKNYLLGRPEAGHPGGVSEAQLDETTRREVADIDALMADLMADAGETVDDGACEDGVRGTEKYDFPWAFFDEVDPLNQHLAGEEEAGQLRVPKPPVGYAPPTLKHIRKVQPLFCELLASKLPEWQSEDVLGQLQSDMRPSKAGGAGNRLSLKPKRPKTTFSESASAGGGGSSSYPAENKSILSTATSRFSKMRLPSLFGRK